MKFKVKIQNLTSEVFSLYSYQNYYTVWTSPDVVNAGETIETQLEFLDVPEGEGNYGKLRFTTPDYKCFQLQAYSEGGNRLKTFTSQDVGSTPSEDIPIVDQETLTVSFAEIAQKKGEPCISKKDAKKAKESKLH